MIPTPQTPTMSHPEVSPGVWTWTAASQPVPPHPTPSQPPDSAPSPKLAIAYALFLALGTGVAGWAMWNAGVAAGQSGSAAKVAALESEASATNARIENFCQGAQ